MNSSTWTDAQTPAPRIRLPNVDAYTSTFGREVSPGKVLVIAGTDTGVGKTMLTVLLARYLRQSNLRVAALKPISSGDRKDASFLRAALDGTLTLDEINPWHFRRPQAPLLAARAEGRGVYLANVLTHVRHLRRRFDCVLVEGAGGLLSPLGEDFSTRELIVSLRATPIVVCPNRLGAISQTRTTLAALPRRFAGLAQVVLVSPAKPDLSTRTNAALLGEFIKRRRIHVMPRVTRASLLSKTSLTAAFRRIASRLLK